MRRLLIRPGAIGDGLCWFPALHALRAHEAQGGETEVWIRDELRPLLPPVVASRALAATGFSLLGIPGTKPAGDLVERLRGFDEILSWTGASQPELQAACEALRLPVQFFAALPGDTAGDLAVSDFFLRQTVRHHGLDAEPEDWKRPGGRRFLLPFLPERNARPAPEAPIVLHPYSGSPAKNWPLERFRSLAERFGGQRPIQWCAAPDDPLPADLAGGAWRFESLRDLALALNGAAAFVGNDSGVSHLAAMVGVPSVVFFGPMAPERWAPRGARLKVVRTASIGASASQIPLEEGVAALENLLAQPYIEG